MRISEILGLKWRCVDLERGLAHVEERYYRGDTDEPKSERSRRSLPLGYLTEALRRRKPSNASPDDYVFHQDGEPLDDRKLMRDWIRLLTRELRIYFPGLGFHSFRREVATQLQEAGASTAEAQLILGHSKPQMTGQYTLLQRKRIEKIVENMQERRSARGVVVEFAEKKA